MNKSILFGLLILSTATSVPIAANAADGGPHYQVAYGTVNAAGDLPRVNLNGTLVDGDQDYNGAGTTTWKPLGGSATPKDKHDDQVNLGLISYKFTEFNNPAVVMFSMGNKANSAVRFVKNEHVNRKLYAQSDTYNLNPPASDTRPREQDLPVSFIAISRSDNAQSYDDKDLYYKSYGKYDDRNKGTPPAGTPPANATASPEKLATDEDLQVSAIRYAGASTAFLNTSIVQDSVGKYTVTFLYSFNDIPAVIVNYNGFVETTKNSNGNKNQYNEPVRSVFVSEVNSTWVKIGITDKDGNPVDANFTMIALGKISPTNPGILLSQMKVAYGRYEKGNNKDVSPTFSDGMGISVKTNEASYVIPFNNDFKAVPYVVATVEHESENHLRQPQVTATASTVTFQVAGRKKCCGTGEGNDARYNILAIYPK